MLQVEQTWPNQSQFTSEAMMMLQNTLAADPRGRERERHEWQCEIDHHKNIAKEWQDWHHKTSDDLKARDEASLSGQDAQKGQQQDAEAGAQHAAEAKSRNDWKTLGQVPLERTPLVAKSRLAETRLQQTERSDALAFKVRHAFRSTNRMEGNGTR